jgi:GTP diphosphokinase / guanosine-3',5'-bis(diphosphate) 3'-diphosphatase
MSNLAKAIRIAAVAHEQQTDKAGEPYVLHVLRVMMNVQGEDQRIVGVLHDLIEDTDWTLDQLRAEGFTDAVVEAVDALTHRPDEDYFDFARRAAQTPLAFPVKRADLHDNLDMSRIPAPTQRDWDRIEKYDRALVLLDEIEAAAAYQDDSH